jgi:hypothetical protein
MVVTSSVGETRTVAEMIAYPAGSGPMNERKLQVDRRPLVRLVPLGQPLRQDHRRAVLDRTVVKRRELDAGELDQLDAVSRLERSGLYNLAGLELRSSER